MKDKAREAFSEDEYQKLLDERVTYIQDLPLINRRCPSEECGLEFPEHVTVRHFDMLQVKKIDEQINQLMGGHPLADHAHDNDDCTSES